MKRQVKISVGRNVGYSVSESVGEGAATSVTAGTGLIDVYAGANAAYSMGRRLRDAYAGSLFRVRRSSDNAEQDIGFNAGTGLVDSGALTTFVGANDGFVVTLYDQSGNARHATQATAGNQPQVVVAGVVNTIGTNGRPVFSCTRATVQYLQATAFAWGSGEVAAFSALRKVDDAVKSLAMAFGVAQAGGGNGSFAIKAPQSAAANVGFRVRGTSVVAALQMNSITAGTDFVLCCSSVLRAAGAQSLRMIRNGVSTTVSASSSLLSTSFGTFAFSMGSGNSASEPASVMMGEVVIYPLAARASASANVDSNMKTFWGIT